MKLAVVAGVLGLALAGCAEPLGHARGRPERAPRGPCAGAIDPRDHQQERAGGDSRAGSLDTWPTTKAASEAPPRPGGPSEGRPAPFVAQAPPAASAEDVLTRVRSPGRAGRAAGRSGQPPTPIPSSPSPRTRSPPRSCPPPVETLTPAPAVTPAPNPAPRAARPRRARRPRSAVRCRAVAGSSGPAPRRRSRRQSAGRASASPRRRADRRTGPTPARTGPRLRTRLPPRPTGPRVAGGVAGPRRRPRRKPRPSTGRGRRPRRLTPRATPR